VSRIWNEERRADLLVALPPWVVARVLVAIGAVVVAAAADELAPHHPTPKLDQGLLAWDADWYDAIADRGYGDLPREAVRFFPLFPALGRGVGLVFGNHQGVALVVIANVLALVAGMLLHRLVLVEKGDEALARRATWLFALFPGSFVMVWGYAEPLMLAAVLGAFLALRRQRWWWAAGLGVVAGLARPLGVFLVLPAAWEVARGWREAPRGDRVARAGAVLGAPLGILAYLVYAEVRLSGFLRPLTEQSPYRGAVTDPLSRLADAAKDFVGADTIGAAVHPPMAVVFVVLAVVLIRRWPAAYALYAVPMLVVALSAESFNSLERYGFNAFPLALALATVTSRPEAERTAVAIGAAGVVALSALAWLGNYVP
jgi:hypothetical protein